MTEVRRTAEDPDPARSRLLRASVDEPHTEIPNPSRDCVSTSFINEFDMVALGFEGASPAETERPPHHPAINVEDLSVGCLSRIQSSRRVER